MFFSTYLPINMRRTNCAIYSRTKSFPEARLIDAHNVLTTGESVTAHVVDDGTVSFTDDLSIVWTLPEIFLAWEAYQVAQRENFSFYSVMDDAGIPQMFISKQFKGHRIVVNAFTFKTLLLTNRMLVNKAAVLVDKKITRVEGQRLFDTMCNIEEGRAKYLTSLLTGRDTVDETLFVSPITSLYSDYTIMYGTDLIEEYRLVNNDKTIETDCIKFENGHFIRKNLTTYPAFTQEHVNFLIEQFVKCSEKKSNYIPLYDEDCELRLFYSTNCRYLVDAQTFEIVTITSQNIKAMLNSMCNKDSCPMENLNLAWKLAKEDSGK